MISSFIADTMENSEALGFCFEPFSGQPHVGVGSRDLGLFRFLNRRSHVRSGPAWVATQKHERISSVLIHLEHQALQGACLERGNDA